MADMMTLFAILTRGGNKGGNRMVTFEGIERRQAGITSCLAKNGMSSLEAAQDLLKKYGVNAFNIVRGIQAICFDDACWAYTLGGAIGRMHCDAQFAGSSSVPAHVEMMGYIGMGNNPMVGATVALAVAIAQAVDIS